MIPRIRFLVQAAFLILSVGVFSGLVSLRPVISFHHSIHVLPALSSLAWWTLPPFLGVTLLFLLLPLIAGRFYCSYLCPAGFFQDLSGRIGARWRGGAWSPANPLALRFSLLAAVLALLVLRSSAFLYLDHFSNLGRLYGFLGSFVSGGPRDPQWFLGALFFVALFLLPLRNPRWFCSTICPSGTLFMWLQKRSLFRVRVNDTCSDCGSCFTACPARCLTSEKGVDQSLCINCLECLPVCPTDSIEFAYAGPFKKTGNRRGGKPLSDDRRRALKSFGAFVLGGATGILFKRKVLAPLIGEEAWAAVPPGSRSTDEFWERCVGCRTCVSVCPTNVLRPTAWDSPLLYFGKVRMDYDRGYCAYECNTCLTACPSGAIAFFPRETKMKIKIGTSELNEKLCIPYAKKRECAACQEQCPTGAITMKKEEGKIPVPVVNKDYCIGCGSCQYACPVIPTKAILVRPQTVHSFAYNPKQLGPKAAKKGIRYIPKPETSEFPF